MKRGQHLTLWKAAEEHRSNYCRLDIKTETRIRGAEILKGRRLGLSPAATKYNRAEITFEHAFSSVKARLCTVQKEESSSFVA